MKTQHRTYILRLAFFTPTLYNKNMEHLLLRALFTLYLVGSFSLSIVYLQYRRCSSLEFTLWATLAFILPVLGPFFVIAARPGPKKRIKRPGLNNQVITAPKG
ncbi:MAG: hypothetical protein NTW32_08215 [Chloroflexi bacterium]|nr:hypothetical protein [Chloroflexota bacterium]